MNSKTFAFALAMAAMLQSASAGQFVRPPLPAAGTSQLLELAASGPPASFRKKVEADCRRRNGNYHAGASFKRVKGGWSGACQVWDAQATGRAICKGQGKKFVKVASVKKYKSGIQVTAKCK